MDDLILLKAHIVNEGIDNLPPDVILENELQRARDFINLRRKHIPTILEPVPLEYSNMVVQLATASVVKTGARGQTGHGENGISRAYKTDDDYPLALQERVLWVC